MLYTLEGPQKQQLIQIQDGAVVSWPAGASKLETNQLSKTATTEAGALMGAFWGMLFGLLFFGLAVGTAVGALMGHFSNYGIDRKACQSTLYRYHSPWFDNLPALMVSGMKNERSM